MPSLERFVNPQTRVFSLNITAMPGARLYFFAAGSSTPKATYADKDGATPNANPVIADSSGAFPPIFLDGLYRVELRSSGNIVQAGWPIDSVGQDRVVVPFGDWNETFTYTEFFPVTGSNGNWYHSIGNGNLGNDPISSPSDWELVPVPVASSFTSDAAYFTWSDDGDQISLDVDPDLFADNFVSSESYFSFSNDSGDVSLDVDISGLSDAVAADLGIIKTSVDVAANGDFGSGNIRCVKIGNTVTITATTTLLHGSSSAPISSDGLIPAAYRPVADVGLCYVVNRTLGYLASLNILASGRLTIEYNDFAGAGVNRTSSSAFSISYNV